MILSILTHLLLFILMMFWFSQKSLVNILSIYKRFSMLPKLMNKPFLQPKWFYSKLKHYFLGMIFSKELSNQLFDPYHLLTNFLMKLWTKDNKDFWVALTTFQISFLIKNKLMPYYAKDFVKSHPSRHMSVPELLAIYIHDSRNKFVRARIWWFS